MANAKKQESERARQWRLARRLTVDHLAELTGWTPQTVYVFERGYQHNGKPVDPFVFWRYRMACAGVEAQLRGLKFNWEQTK
jgi:transcriptional regulator with XRE-family HTH domain